MFVLFFYCIFMVSISHFFTYFILKIREKEFRDYRNHTQLLLTNINEKFELFDDIYNKPLLELNNELNASFN